MKRTKSHHPRPTPFPFLRFALCGQLALLFAPLATACTVPVFRYALDRWPPDEFLVKAPETGLERLPSNPIGNAFFQLHDENVLAVTSPQEVPEYPPMFEGTLDPNDLQALIDSPARQEVVRRLVEGHSAVFLLVGNPDDPQFEEAYATLEESLARMEKELELPYMDPSDPTNELSPGPELRIEFSSLAIDRTDPSERHFIPQLLWGNDPGDGTPVLVPVYGRGRALAAVPVDDELPKVVEDATFFLVGPCSCTVKHLNPGWDLLIVTDWDKRLTEVAERLRAEAEAGPTAATASSGNPEVVRFSASESVSDSKSAEETSEVSLPIARATILLLVLALLGGLTVLVLRKSPPQS